MTVFENDTVEVKASSIEGLGVFAKRLIKAGDTVTHWRPLLVVDDGNKDNLSESDRRYLNRLADGTEVVMNIPERYVNHSCEPNTRVIDNADIAIRDIQPGEEITANYQAEGEKFECTGCNAAICIAKKT